MAEFLIKAEDVTHPDPDKDKRGCYKRGDIVAVMPDGHVWGNEECLPIFYVVRIPGLSTEAAKAYAEPAYVLGNSDFGVAERRKFRFPFWAKLPNATLEKIAKTNWFVPDAALADIEAKP